MSAVGNRGALGELLEQRLEQRYLAGSRFFASEAERIAQLCHQMAERFARGGRLVAFALTPAARSDARHVAVEFVHPVIVGKRALPALALCGESGPVAREVDAVTEPEDIVLAFGEPADGPALASGLSVARARGCLTVAFASLPAEWRFEPPSEDPFVRQELVETTYHVLWELVHVFFEHRGLLKGRTERRVHDVGASSFLYPFLGEREDDLEAVLADVRRSVLMKAEEVHDLRVRTVTEGGGTLGSAAAALRACLDAGGRVSRTRQRRLGHRRQRLGRRSHESARRLRLAAAQRARPDRRHIDHHRDRQRHRPGGDLCPPADRLRPRR